MLAAARRLFASRDPRAVTMDDIAREAGVGRGTLYRRYPDTVSIAVALLDAHERELQEKLLHGEPPLGPGAAPAERMAAFYTAMVELLDQHIDLVLGAEVGDARFTGGAYGFWRVHVRSLLVEADLADPDALVDILLAPLAPEAFRFQKETRHLGPDRITSALHLLARGVFR
ncbi:TetR/AcrR family transcriptional regulator [Fodinicola feengrottensis]|uniref:TetR/AcrR family transcriptional regulator n=1 Tax=Fodinicola feengrottensis TaxID=435914 RepID=UPI0013D6FAD6|nr:TetR/AcrR family transcriptional regulator [Fodinicola feengrottensis]